MRSTFRSMLAALVVVVALGAVASATASAALPEFVTARENTKYPVKFTGKSGAVTIQIKGGGGYSCTSSTITGEITGPKTLAKVVVKYNGDFGCSGYCKQNGHEGLEGWFETKELNGRIAYLNKTTRQVGLLLEEPGGTFAKCNSPIGGGAEKLIGGIIGELGPTNTHTASFHLRYQQLEGEQLISKFEGESVIHRLETVKSPGGTPIPTGIAPHEEESMTTATEIQLLA